jgi:hypothetical protein
MRHSVGEAGTLKLSDERVLIAQNDDLVEAEIRRMIPAPFSSEGVAII